MFNQKNTFCSYRRDSPCVGLRDDVEANELLVHLGGGLSHPSNDDESLLANLSDEHTLRANRIVRVLINVWRLCRGKYNIENKHTVRIIIPAKSGQTINTKT